MGLLLLGLSRHARWRYVHLREIHGLVYVDTNGNGRPDEGEGVGMITLKLGDELTSSMTDVRFGFYNLKPGVYTVKLIVPSLPKDLVVASSQEVTVEILPTGETPEILFRLQKKQEDIRFVEPAENYITPVPAASATPVKQAGSSQPTGVRNKP